jgi:ATP-dependent RNA helicase MSS116
MFAACRRGVVSVCNISRTAFPLFAPAVKSAALSLSARNVSRQAIVSRYLNTSTASGYRTPLAARPQYGRYAHADEEYLEEGTVPTNTAMYSKFQELADNGLVDPNVIREITHGMGHETMTPVQTMTINETLRGRDT